MDKNKEESQDTQPQPGPLPIIARKLSEELDHVITKAVLTLINNGADLKEIQIAPGEKKRINITAPGFHYSVGLEAVREEENSLDTIAIIARPQELSVQ